MVKALENMVTGEQMIAWLVICFLVAYFIYKEWPDFKKRVSKGAVKDQQDRTVEERLTQIEKDIGEIKEKLSWDYDRIKEVENKQKRYQAKMSEEAQELELIMEALLGALGGLQELGANGPTKEAKDNLQNYLNKKAHRSDE